MDTSRLDRIFHPRSVAVIGADEHPGKSGTAIMRNLIESGYEGVVHPVNSRFTALWGRPCVRSVGDIDPPVDLAVIATRITTAPQLIRQCIRAGVGAAVIISPGGKEVGPQGVEMERQIRQAAAGSGLRIIGPNSLGVLCSRCKFNLTTAHLTPPGGHLAFISQSGALATAIFDTAARERIGFSHFVGLGSMADVHFADLIDYLGNDGTVRSIVMYIEHLTHARHFMSAARAVSHIKPIIALKAGRTAAGAMAAACHTGVDTGEDAVYEAAFKRAGILRVRTFEELFDCTELVAKQPGARDTGLVIVSNAGGPAVMAADALGDHGIAPVTLSAETRSRLEEILSPIWSRSNPVDIGRGATARRYMEAVQVLIQARETDGLLLMCAPYAMADPTATAQLLAPYLKGRRIPVIAAWLGGGAMENGREIFNQAGIPTFDSPERAVRAFMDLYHYGRNIEMLRQIPEKLPRHLQFDTAFAAMLINRQMDPDGVWMSEARSMQLLAAYGIPTRPDRSAAGKGISLRHAVELSVGLRKDSIFGPVLTFGWGGAITDILADRGLGIPPLNRLLARRMMEETKVYRLLSGQGHRPQANMLFLEEILIRLSQLAIDFAQVERVDINPLVVTKEAIWAAQAHVLLRPGPVPAPMHLAIAPYPNEYETVMHLPDAGDVFIRPIRPEDARLLQTLFAGLSEQSIYFRFFRPLKSLPPNMLARFTQIDYDREVAMVAIKEEADRPEEMVAVGRIIKDPDPKQAEFAILVGDRWHGKGIGAALLRLCLGIAKSQGVERIWGKVMADNSHMLVLGRRLNFTINRDLDSGEYDLRLDLNRFDAQAHNRR